MEILPKAPTSYKNLIKASFLLYKKSFSKTILLSFLLALTAFAPRIISYFVYPTFFFDKTIFTLARLSVIAVDLISIIFFVGILWHVHCVMINKHEPLIEDLTRGTKKVFYVFFAILLQSAIIAAILLIIYSLQLLMLEYHLLFGPHLINIIVTFIIFTGEVLLIIYLFTLFIFFVPLIAIRNLSILNALDYCISLTWNNCWRTFSLQVTPWLCYILFLMLVKFILGIDIYFYFTGSNPPIWATLIQLVTFALFMPWVASLLLLQLHDLELRKKAIPTHGKTRKQRA